MLAAEIISHLQRRGITLKVVAGSLKVRGVEKLSASEKTALRTHRSAILKVLAAGPDNPIAATASAPVAPPYAITTVSTANRQTMPQIAAVVDQLRSLFGPVQVVFASEGGKELGLEPLPGVRPVITGAGAPTRTTGRRVRP